MNDRAAWLVALAVFVLISAYYAAVFILDVDTDIQNHLGFLNAWLLDEGPLPGNPLFYLSTWVLSGFGNSMAELAVGATLVLAISVAAKFLLTYWFLRTPQGFDWVRVGVWSSICLALGLAFAFSLPLQALYLDSSPPNVWHNSTTMVSAPFAIALFSMAVVQVNNPDRSRLILMTLICAVGVLAKPSFYMAFAPSYALVLVLHFGISRKALVNLVPILVGGAVMIIMYTQLYEAAPVSQASVDSESASGVAVRSISDAIRALFLFPLSLLASIAFPLMYLLLNPGRLMSDATLRFAWGLFVVSLIVPAVFYETGPRSMHGNFYWGSMLGNYILFCATARAIGERLSRSGRTSWREYLSLLVLFAHAIAGVNYMAQMIIQRSYFL